MAIRSDTAKERRAQIMDAALHVFAQKGFARATNKDIAHAAGIQSSGLIYHYFRDKEDLLRSAIEANAPPLQLVADPSALMQLPLASGLRLLATKYIEMTNNPHVVACLRVLIGEAMRNDAFAQTISAFGPRRIWHLIAAYLEAKVECGEIRPIDTEKAAWSFLGGLLGYLIAGRILSIDPGLIEYPETFIDTHVDIFIRGLAPEE